MFLRSALLAIAFFLADYTAAQIPSIGQDCGSVCDDAPETIETRARIAPAEEPGEPLIIEGVVRRQDGSPAANIIVYAYQTNADGIYPPDNRVPGVLRGWVRTDDEGRYRFDTIRPGPYPDDDIPAHVHLHIIEPDRVTYIVDDIIFTDDPLWPSRWAPDMRSGRGGDGLGDPSRNADGVWRLRNDIILGEGITGYDAAWAD